jgi:hypothetical protein
MIYDDVPAGATVFMDASVFIHHFEPNDFFGPAATEAHPRDVSTDRGIPGAACS